MHSTQSLQRRAFLGGALLSVGIVGVTPAHSHSAKLPQYANQRTALNAPLVTVEVAALRTHEPFPIFRGRDGRSYVAGETGRPYKIIVRNNSGLRLLVVPSVDGVNALTGQTASTEQSGYILEPFGRLSIDGWRKSMQEVAEFVFTPQRDAYAVRTGRPDHVGVIGLALFKEAAPVVLAPAPSVGGLQEKSRSNFAESGADRVAPAAAPRLGTGHGERHDSHARHGEFVRASSSPDVTIALQYDSLANLEAQGIAVRRIADRPNPFPADGFVPDPPRR